MNPEITFKSPFSTLQLQRWPRRRGEILRAWDGADLYLLEHLAENNVQGPFVIFNDICGAVSLSLPNCSSSGDSFLAQQALFENAKDNLLANPSWLWPSDTPPQVSTILIRIPKSTALLEYQLCQVNASQPPGTSIIFTGIDKHLPPNLIKIAERYIENPKAHLGRHKARLFFGFSRAPSQEKRASSVQVPLLDASLRVDPGVFSQDSFDLGARFLIEQIPSGVIGHIADLGCGNGVIGLVAAKQNPTAKIFFCDESFQAIRSVRANAAALFPTREFYFHHGNGLDGLTESFEYILLNPPFHRGHAVDDGVAMMLFAHSKRQLAAGGRLLVIGNRQLPYRQALQRLFSRVEQVATDKRFTIWAASNR